MKASPETLLQPVIHVVDDDASMRLALEDLLASVGLQVCSHASVADFLAGEPPDAPGCLILDIRMPGQSGMDFHRQMQGHGLRLPVIFITGHGDIAMGVEAMKNGAIEFLPKPFRDQDLLDAIQRGLAQDQERRSREAGMALLHGHWEALTTGEQAVMKGVARGLLNKQIADELGLSEVTVKVRRGNVMKKMQARTLADLIRMADRLGL
ncbi:response regulator transcription factor [Kerstersia similis]|uniref:response regulator transcription factor n=1 Tax=Kerstersia similis TaxID=206505 RepID=UPI0039EED2DF